MTIESSTPGRRYQAVLILSLLPLCWLGMMVVHELGHVLGALASDGQVERVVLHPLTISRTDVSPNPHPLFVTWAGPVIGVALPVLLFLLWLGVRAPAAHLWRFFTGFCLIANGLYIGVGSFERIGDAGDLLRHGAAAWQLWLFGLLTVPAGVYLWHGQGKHFGLGRAARPVSRATALAVLAALTLLVLLELLLSGTE